MWHAWLHHLKDNVPDININFAWQQSYVPNLTGTKLAYNLTPISANISPIYKKWQPK
jgi:NADH:ubiquinone oxidoreductase subunit